MNGKKCTQLCTCKHKNKQNATKVEKVEKVGEKDKEFNPYCACNL